MALFRGWRRPNGRTDVVKFVGREECWLTRETGRPTLIRLPWDWGVPTFGAHELAYALLREIGLTESAAHLYAGEFVRGMVLHLGVWSWALSQEEIIAWFIDEACTRIAVATEALVNGDPVPTRHGEGGADERA